MLSRGFIRRATGGLIVAGALTVAAPLAAQEQSEPAILVILDANSIDHGPPPHELPSELVNDAIAGAGVREELPYFAARTGQDAVLLGGDVSNPGWFALTSAPDSWISEPGANDGLSNFVLAGAGVGSPDATGDRESLLRQVSDVVPLQSAGLAMLIGRSVCGVIYDHDILVVQGNPTDITGPTLGILAFKVVRLIEPSSLAALPKVEIEITEAHEVCHGPLTPFSAPPEPNGQP